MKFKVTATIPVELEIDCQSKEEALNTATTILQEQRDDGDYASIVADCIESALVSGSITMTAVDDHEALVNELRTKRKISIQDMDAFADGVVDVDNSIKCLIASGVEQDRAKIVLRTLGYTLFNAELFPEIA